MDGLIGWLESNSVKWPLHRETMYSPLKEDMFLGIKDSGFALSCCKHVTQPLGNISYFQIHPASMKIQNTNLKFLIMECLDLHDRLCVKQAGRKMDLVFNCQYCEYFFKCFQ